MKSKAGNFLLAAGGYVLYLFSGVFAALILTLFEFLKNFFEKGSIIPFADSFQEIAEKNSSLVLLLSYVIVIAFVFLTLKLRRKDIGRYAGFSGIYPLGIFGAMILGMALNFVTFSLVSPEVSGDREITTLLMLCILLSPFVEELVFREILLRLFGKACGALIAILITSLLFGVSHTGAAQTIYAFVLGIVLCVVRIRSGSLWSAVALHLAFNLSGIVLATSELELPGIAFFVFPVLIILSFMLACSGKRKMRSK